MARFPIKMLKDEQGQPFVPAVSADTISMTSGYSLQTEIDNKLEPENIIAGNNIEITKNDNDCVVNGPNIMNNVTTTQSGEGVLDAHQGKVLNDRITTLANTIDTNETDIEGKMTAVQNRVTELENGKVDKEVGKGLSTNDFTNELKTKLNGVESGAQVNTITGIKGDAETNYRTGNVNIAKANIGLSNVENKSSATIRGEITSINVTDALGFTPIDGATKGVPGGIAELGTDGKVPAAQLPSFVDDVVEFADRASFPTTGESGKIYVASDTNLTYRWSGTSYIEISQSLALGETASTAYPGDKGAAAYTHAVTNKGSAFASGLYKVTTNSEGHVTGAIAVQKKDITDLGIPGSDTTYSNATTTSDGLMSKEDKDKIDSLATVASSGSYNDLSDKPDIPTKVGELTNDAGYITGYTETDPTVPEYIKGITQEEINKWNNPDAEIIKIDIKGKSYNLYDKELGFYEFTNSSSNQASVMMTQNSGRVLYSGGKMYCFLCKTIHETRGVFVIDVNGVFLYTMGIGSYYTTSHCELSKKYSFYCKEEGSLDIKNTIEYTPTDDYNPATKKYVDDSIATIPELFLGDYLAKGNTIEFIPTGDYNPSTKKYVDDKFNTVPTNLSAFTNDSGFITDTQLVATADTKQDVLTAGDNITIADNVISADIPIYFFENDGTINGSDSWDTDKNRENAAQVFNHYINNEPYIITGANGWCFDSIHSFGSVGNRTFMIDFKKQGGGFSSTTGTTGTTYSVMTLRYYEDGGTIYASTSTDFCVFSDSDMLCPNSTYEYTPKKDYNPATKKYVDDSIKTAIGSALGGSY